MQSDGEKMEEERTRIVKERLRKIGIKEMEKGVKIPF